MSKGTTFLAATLALAAGVGGGMMAGVKTAQNKEEKIQTELTEEAENRGYEKGYEAGIIINQGHSDEELAEAVAEAEAAKQTIIDGLNEDKQTLTQQNSTLTEQNTALETQNQTLTQEKTELTEQNSQLTEQNMTLAEEYETLRSQIPSFVDFSFFAGKEIEIFNLNDIFVSLKNEFGFYKYDRTNENWILISDEIKNVYDILSTSSGYIILGTNSTPVSPFVYSGVSFLSLDSFELTVLSDVGFNAVFSHYFDDCLMLGFGGTGKTAIIEFASNNFSFLETSIAMQSVITGIGDYDFIIAYGNKNIMRFNHNTFEIENIAVATVSPSYFYRLNGGFLYSCSSQSQQGLYYFDFTTFESTQIASTGYGFNSFVDCGDYLLVYTSNGSYGLFCYEYSTGSFTQLYSDRNAYQFFEVENGFLVGADSTSPSSGKLRSLFFFDKSGKTFTELITNNNYKNYCYDKFVRFENGVMCFGGGSMGQFYDFSDGSLTPVSQQFSTIYENIKEVEGGLLCWASSSNAGLKFFDPTTKTMISLINNERIYFVTNVGDTIRVETNDKYYAFYPSTKTLSLLFDKAILN